jgi:hypothetical protein
MSFLAKVGTFIHPSTAISQSITGVGFQPKVVLFFMSGDSQGSVNIFTQCFHSFGAADGTNQFYVSMSASDAVTTTDVPIRRHTNASCIGAVLAGSATVSVEAGFTSMDSDGFTVGWTTADSNGRMISYIALGGTDIQNAKVGNFLPNAGTGSFSLTGVGFKPDLVLLSSVGSNAMPSLANSNSRANLGIGMAGITQQFSGMGISSGVAAGTSAAGSYQRTSEFFAYVNNTTVAFECTLTSLDNDGFTINETTGGANYIFYVALNGTYVKAQGSFNQPTSNGSQTISVPGGFKPALVFLQSDNFASSASVQTPSSRFSQAATDGVSVWGKWTGYSNTNPTKANNYFLGGTVAGSDKFFQMGTEGGGGAATAIAKLVSLDTSGFTLNWTFTSATAREVHYLALGTGPVVDTFSISLAYQGS